jgi:putative protein-disulfide isomerase
MPIEVRHYTDPSCEWSWAAEPQLRRLSWEFGDELAIRPTMVGLARTLEPADHSERLASWLEAAARSGMPCDPRLWTQNPISSTYPVCIAVLAAAEQGLDSANRYLRRAREALLCERGKLDHPDALIALAGPAGLDQARFVIDLRSNAITEEFSADLERSRALDGGPEPRPVLVFTGADGESRELRGPRAYEDYRDAAVAAGARPGDPGPAEPLPAIARFGRCATRELEELSGRPRTVVEAELWSLARDWRLKPVPALTGTLWELP